VLRDCLLASMVPRGFPFLLARMWHEDRAVALGRLDLGCPSLHATGRQMVQEGGVVCRDCTLLLTAECGEETDDGRDIDALINQMGRRVPPDCDDDHGYDQNLSTFLQDTTAHGCHTHVGPLQGLGPLHRSRREACAAGVG
jgi:hypothetical protein